MSSDAAGTVVVEMAAATSSETCASADTAATSTTESSAPPATKKTILPVAGEESKLHKEDGETKVEQDSTITLGALRRVLQVSIV